MFWRNFLPTCCLVLISLSLSLTQITNITPDYGDPAFKNYLESLMKNYSVWLADKDPAPTVATPVLLKGTNVSGHNVDVEFEISNQYMTGHSKVSREDVFAISALQVNAFSVQCSTAANDVIEFGGHYVIKNGVLNIATVEHRFTGEGNWTLKTSPTSEGISYIGFKENEQGFVDLTPVKNKTGWIYVPTWTEIHFEGISLTSEQSFGQQDENVAIVEKALAEVYAKFLRREGINETERQYIIPRQFMIQYFDDTLGKSKLSDILSEWEPATTVNPGETTESVGDTMKANWIVVLSSFVTFLNFQIKS